MTRSAAVLLSAMVLASCGGSPKTHFYTLDAVRGSQPAPAAHVSSPIVVGQPQLPGELDRAALVTRGAGNTIVVSDRDHWAAPLDDLVRRTLTLDLRTRLPAGSVLAPGDPVPKNGRTLMVNVRRFMADESGHVTLDADWAVRRGNQSAPTRLVSVTADAESRSGDAIAAAMSQALGKLADQIAAAL